MRTNITLEMERMLAESIAESLTKKPYQWKTWDPYKNIKKKWLDPSYYDTDFLMNECSGLKLKIWYDSAWDAGIVELSDDKIKCSFDRKVDSGKRAGFFKQTPVMEKTKDIIFRAYLKRQAFLKEKAQINNNPRVRGMLDKLEECSK